MTAPRLAALAPLGPLVALTALAAFAVHAAAGSVTLLSLDRSLRAGDDQRQPGPHAGLAWSNSLSRTTRPARGQVVKHGPASHDSMVMLGDDSIRIDVDLAAAAYVQVDLDAVQRVSPILATPLDEFATSGAAFALTFQIDRPYDYQFQGRFGSRGESSAFWSGLGRSGSTLIGSPNPWDLSLTGTLGPGTHTLDSSLLVAAALSGPADPIGEAWADFTFDAHAQPLATVPPQPIPAPSAAVWGTALLLTLLATRRGDREP